MSEPLLFDVPPQDSPRLAWMKIYDIHTQDTGQEGECPEMGHDFKRWGCWSGDMGDAMASDEFSEGDTEGEAIADWAKRHGVLLWNEIGLKP